MDSTPFFHPHQPTQPSIQNTPFGPPPVHYPLPAVYSGVAPNYGGYNIDWGPEDHAFLQVVNQMLVAQPPTTGMAATTHNVGYQCRWLSGGIPCNEAFADFDDLIIHLGHVHGMRGPAGHMLVCQWLTERGVCGGEYRRDGYRRHIEVHLGHSVDCPQCGKSYSRRDSLRAHVKKVHGK